MNLIRIALVLMILLEGGILAQVTNSLGGDKEILEHII